MAGMSERSARKWQCDPLPSETKQERRWSTRPDPFEGVWEEESLPLLRGEAAGRLRAARLIVVDQESLDKNIMTRKAVVFLPRVVYHSRQIDERDTT